ncbi:hypothetical protein LTR66_017609, partial [Elasticomyces elasticus]
MQTILQRLSGTSSTSLLGYLGSDSALSTLDVLMSSTKSLSTASAAWSLLTSLIDKDQQWLSVVILTGKIPGSKKARFADEESKACAYRGRLVIDSAIDQLLNIAELAPPIAVAILNFLGQAQHTWSWTLTARKELYPALYKYVTDGPSTSTSSLQFTQITSAILDLSSIHLQYAKHIRDKEILNEFRPMFTWLIANAIEVSTSNTALRTRFKKNFQNKFHIHSANFEAPTFGTTASAKFYNKDLAKRLLHDRDGWKNNYDSEMDRINDDLSQVQADLTLFNSFSKLCLEHVSFFSKAPDVQNVLAHIANKCLTTNTKTYPEEQIFDRLLQLRADTALAL